MSIQPFLGVDLLLAEGRIGMREVGEQQSIGIGRPWSSAILRASFQRRGPLQVEEAAVELEAVDVEGRREIDPLADGHRAVDAEVVHPGFGEGGELRHCLVHEEARSVTQEIT